MVEEGIAARTVCFLFLIPSFYHPSVHGFRIIPFPLLERIIVKGALVLATLMFIPPFPRREAHPFYVIGSTSTGKLSSPSSLSPSTPLPPLPFHLFLASPSNQSHSYHPTPPPSHLHSHSTIHQHESRNNVSKTYPRSSKPPGPA